MIAIAFIILLTLIFIRLQKGMFAALLVFLATKSIMDVFWNINVGSFSMLAIQGFLVPFLFLNVFQKRNLLPHFWLSTANLYLVAMSFGIIWGIFENPLGIFQNGFLSFNSFLGFFLIPILVTDQKRLKLFLLALILSGIFPILVSIYQLLTGVIFEDRATVGLSRYVGFYHDAFPMRFHGLLTLISILIYQYVFQIRNVLFKVFLFTIAGGALLSIYAVFSKAGVLIICLWVVLLLLFSKSKIKQLFSTLFFLYVIFLVFGDAASVNIEQLFSKEVGYQIGEVTDVRYTLAGRGYIWQEYWDFWVSKQTVFFKFFGDGISRPVHNEYFRVLLSNGIIGLLFLITFIIKTTGNLLKMNKNIRLFGTMLLVMYLIDCIGLVPGLYYYYNIVVWGIFGILLMKPKLFIKQ